MRVVSPSYAPYADARWSNLRVSFRLIDNAAAADATPSASEAEAISQLAQLHDGVEGMTDKYATLENGGWPLDGSCNILPDDVSAIQTGWWSGLSGADGLFVSPPVLTFDFATAHSSIGFTVVFDDKADWYPKEFIVDVYDAADVLLGSETVICTSTYQVVELPATDYRKVVLTFNETQLPYQRVRVSEVLFGIVQIFDKNNLTDGSLLYELSPGAEALPSNELVITIDNSDRKYNMSSPSSLYAYLQQGQPLDSELGVGAARNALEYAGMGRFYFFRAEAEDDAMTAKITAYDRARQLDKSVYRLGETGTWTVTAAVAAVITDSGVPITASIPATIGARTVRKSIPQGTTHRNALRMIAQAAMCTCFFNRDDELEFVELAVGTPVDILDNGNMPKAVRAIISDPVNTVNVTVREEYLDVEVVFTATNMAAGETPQVREVECPLSADGNAVAAWLLAMAQHRLTYNIAERGNPAREIGDTTTVYDAYDENSEAVIIREQYSYDGTLEAESRGWA